MKKILTIMMLGMIVFSLSGCKPVDDEDTNVVYTTVYPLQYIINGIAGDTVEVKRVPGSTNSGHNDELHWTGKEIIDMLKSDLLIYVDGGYDNYIANSIDSVFNDGDVKLFNLSENIMYNEVCYSHEHNHDDEDEEHDEPLVDPISMCEENMLSDDPHFWLDPGKMADAAEVIKDQLIEAFPENTELYESNYVALKALLDTLDEDFNTLLSVATKPIITTNMLFNYWHSSYELEIISLSADAHNSEVVPSEVIEFVHEAVEHEIHYILYEANTNSPTGDLVLEQLLLEDATATSAELHSLANLTTEQEENGVTYLTLMYENLSILEEALK